MILAIVQARMSSRRLPGKILKEIKGKPLIFYVLNQVKKSKLVDNIVLASTNKEKDALLLETVKREGFETFAGSEDDVLDRYYRAAKKFRGDTIVRVTGDCPLIDPEIIDKVIQGFISSDCDYASNIHPPSFPDGLDVEVFSFNALKKAWEEAKLKSEREHVTPYIWKNKDKFKIVNFVNEKNLNKLRWTVDEEEDFILITKIIEKLEGSEINMNNVLDIFKRYPELNDINKKYKRNVGYARSLKGDLNEST
ncbi:glycosyltransferase family protein [Candidatus Woesearchaeota archaeon]|nr:glycosyltransferase family protein [Candidatus Woesearchaeota archaeon]